MSNSRRYFTDSFKKEIVFKIVNNITSMNEISNFHKIDKLLLKRWVARYSPSVGQMPENPIGETVTVLNSQLDRLIEAILVKKMEQLLVSYQPKERQMTDTYKAQKMVG